MSSPPLDPVDRDVETGAMLYNEAEAEQARASQPGRGHRSDGHDAPSAEQLGSLPAAQRALWDLMRDSGLQVGDALDLVVQDVDVARGEVAFGKAKSRGRRTIPLGEDTARLMRETVGDREAGPLFLDEDGRPLSRKTAKRAAHDVPQLHDISKLSRATAEAAPTAEASELPKMVQLQTLVRPDTRQVFLDAAEVVQVLRAFAAVYQAPLHRMVAAELERLADQMEMQALTALDGELP